MLIAFSYSFLRQQKNEFIHLKDFQPLLVFRCQVPSLNVVDKPDQCVTNLRYILHPLLIEDSESKVTRRTDQ